MRIPAPKRVIRPVQLWLKEVYIRSGVMEYRDGNADNLAEGNRGDIFLRIPVALQDGATVLKYAFDPVDVLVRVRIALGERDGDYLARLPEFRSGVIDPIEEHHVAKFIGRNHGGPVDDQGGTPARELPEEG